MQEKQVNYDLKYQIDIKELFQRIQQLTGVKLTIQAQLEFKGNPSDFQFLVQDIEAIVPTIKHLNVIDYAEENVLVLKTLSMKVRIEYFILRIVQKGREKDRLLKLAQEKLDTSCSFGSRDFT